MQKLTMVREVKPTPTVISNTFEALEEADDAPVSKTWTEILDELDEDVVEGEGDELPQRIPGAPET